MKTRPCVVSSREVFMASTPPDSDPLFRQAFEHAAIGMALVAPDGRFLRVNRSMCDLTGYAEPDLPALTFQAITHPDDLAADLAHARRLLAGAITHYHLEKRYVHKAGHTVWGLLSRSLVRGEAGDPLYFITQVQDITARKRAEEDREQLIEELRTALETVEELQTLLPVCAWCKQVRSDEGYWETLETYLREHHDFAFTHGMCPTCFDREVAAHRKKTE